MEEVTESSATTATITDQPSLKIVKPGVKKALAGTEVSRFEKCLCSDAGSLHPLVVKEIMEGVIMIDNVLTIDECTSLCCEIDGSKELSFWSPSSEGDELRKFRDANTIEVNSQSFVSMIWTRVQEVLGQLGMNVTQNEIDNENGERELIGSWIADNLNYDMLFAKYPSFGAFAPHTDGRAVHTFNYRSFYSVIIYLNEISPHCGGGTLFYQESAVNSLERVNENGRERWTASSDLATIEVSPTRGRMLIFEQSLVHEGVPPQPPFEKYIIRSDVMFRRYPAICDTERDREAFKLFQLAESFADRGSIPESVALFKKAFKMSPSMASVMGQC